MVGSLRFNAVLLCSALVFAAGCEKSATPASSGSAPGADPASKYTRPTDGAGKKLVGTWEGTDDEMKDKDGKPGTVVVEFKADGNMKITMGPFDLTGTFKVTKEDGKVLTVDTEMSLPDFGGKGAGKPDKKTFSITIENDDTIVMTPTDKKEPKTLKRKK